MTESLSIPADFAEPVDGTPDLLVIAGERRGLCSLHETARPFCVGLKFHRLQLHRQTLRLVLPRGGKRVCGPGIRRPHQIWENIDFASLC